MSVKNTLSGMLRSLYQPGRSEDPAPGKEEVPAEKAGVPVYNIGAEFPVKHVESVPEDGVPAMVPSDQDQSEAPDGTVRIGEDDPFREFLRTFPDEDVRAQATESFGVDLFGSPGTGQDDDPPVLFGENPAGTGDDANDDLGLASPDDAIPIMGSVSPRTRGVLESGEPPAMMGPLDEDDGLGGLGDLDEDDGLGGLGDLDLLFGAGPERRDNSWNVISDLKRTIRDLEMQVSNQRREIASADAEKARLRNDLKRAYQVSSLIDKLRSYDNGSTSWDARDQARRLNQISGEQPFHQGADHDALRRRVSDHINAVLWPEKFPGKEGDPMGDAMRLRIMDLSGALKAAITGYETILAALRHARDDAAGLDNIEFSLATHIAFAQSRHLHRALIALAENHPAFDQPIESKSARTALKRAGKEAVIRDAVLMTPKALFALNGIGKASYTAIVDQLDATGIPNIHSISREITAGALPGEVRKAPDHLVEDDVMGTLRDLFALSENRSLQAMVWGSLEREVAEFSRGWTSAISAREPFFPGLSDDYFG